MREGVGGSATEQDSGFTDEEVAALEAHEKAHQEGKIFDPDYGVEDLRSAPKSERPQRVRQFKERFAAQREELAALEELLVSAVHEHPDASAEELAAYLEAADPSNILPIHKTIAHRLIEHYVATRSALRIFRDSCHDDAGCLFFKISGRHPRGTVTVASDPVSLYFRCADLGDYAQLKKRGVPDEDDIKKAQQTGGTQIIFERYGIELYATVENASAPGAMEAGSNAIIRIHEAQHALTRFFQKRMPKLVSIELISDRERRRVTGSFESFRDAAPEVKRLLLNRYFRWWRHHYESEEHAGPKAEILSYFKQGASGDHIFDVLTKSHARGGIYDYFTQMKVADTRLPIKEDAIQKVRKFIYGVHRPTDAADGRLIRASAD